MIMKAYTIYDHLYLGRGPKLAWAAVNAGTAAMIAGDSHLAEKYYKFSIFENDCAIPKSDRPHVYSLTIYNNLAVLYEKSGCHNKSTETISFALEHISGKSIMVR